MGKTVIIAILILVLIGVVVYYEYPQLISTESGSSPKINLNPLKILNPKTEIKIYSNMEWSLSMSISEKIKLSDSSLEMWFPTPNYLTRKGNYTYSVQETDKRKITYISLSITHPIYEELPIGAYIKLEITKGNKIILNGTSTTRKSLEYKPDIDF